MAYVIVPYLNNEGDLRIENIEEIYFASWETPLRGARFYELEGNRFMLTNFEFRFPLIRRLQMGFPLPLALWNVRGAIFTDMGFAWNNDEKFKPFTKSPSGFIMTRIYTDEAKGYFDRKQFFMSYGFGARLNMGWFVLQFDLAWPTDLYRTFGGAHVIWSLGAEF